MVSYVVVLVVVDGPSVVFSFVTFVVDVDVAMVADAVAAANDDWLKFVMKL